MSRGQKIRSVLIQLLIIIVLTLFTSISVKGLVKEQADSFALKQELIIADLINETDIDAKQLKESFTNPKIEAHQAEDILKQEELRAIRLYNGFSLDEQQYKIYQTIPKLVAGMGLLIVAINMLIKYKQQQRLQRLNDNVNQALNNDFDLDINQYFDDNISALETDVYKMIGKLKSMQEYTLQEKKNLEDNLSDISHQLKTPLTSMFIINDILEQDDVDPEFASEFLKKNRKQLERVEWLIKSILKMSQIDSGTIEFTKETISSQEFIDFVLNELSVQIELKEIDIHLELDDSMLSIDKKWTAEALKNIIKNAIEYSEPQGKICISAEKSLLNTTIIIEDFGVGMNEGEVRNIFKRFYKGNKDSDSIGIGLNMSKTIIERQFGEISVKSQENKGTKFIITLPN